MNRAADLTAGHPLLPREGDAAMIPQRTHSSTDVFRPDTPDADAGELWVTVYTETADGTPAPAIGSTWKPTLEERIALSQGACLEVVVQGKRMPHIMVRISPHKLGEAPSATCEEEGHDWPEHGEHCTRCGVSFAALFGWTA